jgi:hypothetical protein
MISVPPQLSNLLHTVLSLFQHLILSQQFMIKPVIRHPAEQRGIATALANLGVICFPLPTDRYLPILPLDRPPKIEFVQRFDVCHHYVKAAPDSHDRFAECCRRFAFGKKSDLPATEIDSSI